MRPGPIPGPKPLMCCSVYLSRFMLKAPHLAVVKIKVRIRIDAPRERIWEFLGDSNNDPYFWRGITSVRNLSRNGNVLIREVILGDDNTCTQAVTVWPPEKIQTRWVGGVIEGTREILLISVGASTLLEIHINYEFPGLGQSDSKLLAKLFQNEAEFAADLIKRKAEEFYSDSQLERKLWVN